MSPIHLAIVFQEEKQITKVATPQLCHNTPCKGHLQVKRKGLDLSELLRDKTCYAYNEWPLLGPRSMYSKPLIMLWLKSSQYV
ncbi:hypothetical protein GUJ93_ZPchr0011g27291 [Zizania palustris]|uniref:Uncharacterized protein n=1 Tax=Zizania palustris TaxID=103762 RepID=A0A8J6BSF8_ZIZPA|nr:hypothetical protein GUJ93_ZPchr0011g27291 [Zizania palustris]